MIPLLETKKEEKTQRKKGKKYVSTENTTEDSGGKKNGRWNGMRRRRKKKEKEDEEAVNGVLPSFVFLNHTPFKAAKSNKAETSISKAATTCFYCKTNSHRVEANTLSLDHCNAFINDVNLKPINAIKFKFMDGTIERLRNAL